MKGFGESLNRLWSAAARKGGGKEAARKRQRSGRSNPVIPTI